MVKSFRTFAFATPSPARKTTCRSTVCFMLLVMNRQRPSSVVSFKPIQMATSLLFPGRHKQVSRVSSPPETCRTNATAKLSHLLEVAAWLHWRRRGFLLKRKRPVRSEKLSDVCMMLYAFLGITIVPAHFDIEIAFFFPSSRNVRERTIIKMR